MEKKNLSVLILAAGKGTRMKSKKSKVLHEVGNKTLISHLIDTCNELKLRNINIIVNENNQDIKNILPKYVKTIIQKKQLGTADAILAAKKYYANYNGYILVLYADVPLIKSSTLKKLIKNSIKCPSLLSFHAKDPKSYGRIIEKNNYVKEVIEEKNIKPEEKNIKLCNSGIFCIKAKFIFELLHKIKKNKTYNEFLLTDIFFMAFQKNQPFKKILVEQDEVIGINNRKQLALAEEIYQNTLKNKFFNKGVTFIAPKTTFLSFDTEIGADVKVGANVYLGRAVKIKSDVEIGSNCNIEQTTVFSGVTLGPLCRIRNNSIIKKNAKIGNFVEIKNSIIGSNTKVSHLSYIGDTRIGKNSNIGAGTITCNYDGKNKNKSTIGNNVFIGSNCSLIAPIVIKDYSFVAAGSTVSKSLDKYDFSIARAKQKVIKKGSKKFIN